MPSTNIRVVAMLEANFVTGAAKSVLEFAREATITRYDLSQIEISVIAFNRLQNQDSLAAGVLNAGATLDVVLERRRFDAGVIGQLRTLIEAKRPDVLWSHSVKSHFLVRFAGLNRSLKWVASHHGYTSTDTKTRLYNQLDRWSLRSADRVLTVCEPFAKKLKSIGVHADRIRIQHMPIRPFQAVKPGVITRLRENLALGGETRVVLSVGRLSAEKGHHDLIRAFRDFRRIHPDLAARLVLVGGGPEQEHLASLCQRLKISEDVTFAGHQNDVNPYYAIADLFVLPSHSEGSPHESRSLRRMLEEYPN
jgi:glycosyltransferase involved in cell wall biosynthesis